ncbi:MAG: rRNA pseudouridine synthase [Clostridia bacterium]|nr:rRNA pseudouridine synthase [Clostridia bacterium]
MLIKIQKYFTDCGVLSRRAAEEAIKRGEVTVNGRPAELGMRIDPDADTVEYRGKRLKTSHSKKICIMLNKPRGFVTTMSDEKGRRSVDMLVGDIGERIYPVGRLDMDSDGLLLMTNDGELANMLTHPRHSIPKIYKVWVKGSLSDENMRILRSALVIDGYKIKPVKSVILKNAEHERGFSVIEMTLFEGRNRQIRKMCAMAGLEVDRLSRVAYGTLRLGDLPEGRWRALTDAEIKYLKSTPKTNDNKNNKKRT